MLRHPVTMIGMTSMRADRTNDFLKHTMHVDITCRMANILEEIRHENDDQSSSSKRSCARLRLPKPQQKVYAAYEIQHTIEFVANNREDAHGDALQRLAATATAIFRARWTRPSTRTSSRTAWPSTGQSSRAEVPMLAKRCELR